MNYIFKSICLDCECEWLISIDNNVNIKLIDWYLPCPECGSKNRYPELEDK